MEQPRVIGHVVSVNGFRIKVELSPEAKSSSRATPDGVQRAVAINSFLTFDLGAGSFAIGILSDLEAREAFDPTRYCRHELLAHKAMQRIWIAARKEAVCFA